MKIEIELDDYVYNTINKEREKIEKRTNTTLNMSEMVRNIIINWVCKVEK